MGKAGVEEDIITGSVMTVPGLPLVNISLHLLIIVHPGVRDTRVPNSHSLSFL